MTDRQATDQIIADSFDPPTSRRERELAERISLLENMILYLQEANEGLAQQLAEARDQIKTLKSVL
jgi:hypothetical protein